MEKDFHKWHQEKEKIHNAKGATFFHEREVWWCAIGANVGFEMDGHGELFTRPVIIVSKFNLDVCLIVPLTARPKKGKYYFPIGKIEDKEATAVLSQIRFVDRKRLHMKITTLDKGIFEALLKKVIGACFPSLK